MEHDPDGLASLIIVWPAASGIAFGLALLASGEVLWGLLLLAVSGLLMGLAWSRLRRQ